MNEYLFDGFSNEIEKIAMSDAGKEEALVARHGARTALGTPAASLWPFITTTMLGNLIAGRLGAKIGAGVGLSRGIEKSLERSKEESEELAKAKGISADKLKYVNIPVKAATGGIGGLALGHIIKSFMKSQNKAILPITAALGAISGGASEVLNN